MWGEGVQAWQAVRVVYDGLHVVDVRVGIWTLSRLQMGNGSGRSLVFRCRDSGLCLDYGKPSRADDRKRPAAGEDGGGDECRSRASMVCAADRDMFAEELVYIGP